MLAHHRATLVPDNELLDSFVESLAATLDLRERETGLHSKRVACHTLVLARRFYTDSASLQQIYWGSLLHDIGKIAIPDAILLKGGRLTEDEWEAMRRHPALGYDVLARVAPLAGAAQIVLCHEERFDGSGYPQRLKGEQIPFGARLFAVIDTLDAMASDRPYRRALDFDAAKSEIMAQSGFQFDPVAVDAFLAEELILREMVSLHCAQRPPLFAQADEERGGCDYFF